MMALILGGCKYPASEDSHSLEDTGAEVSIKETHFQNSTYRFQDARGQTPYVILFEKSNQWVASLVKKATGTKAHPSGGLDISFVGIHFYQTPESKAQKKVHITFIGKTTAYKSDKAVLASDLLSGKQIDLGFSKTKSLLGNSIEAVSSLSFYYSRDTDTVVLKRGAGKVIASTYFKTATDSAEIKNIKGHKDQRLIATLNNLTIEE